MRERAETRSESSALDMRVTTQRKAAQQTNAGGQLDQWQPRPFTTTEASTAFLGAQKRAQMLCHSCILGDPQTKGDKISGCLTDAF